MFNLGKVLSLTVAILFSLQSFACDEGTICPSCGEKSEFTWSPSNKFVTTRLSRFYNIENLIMKAYQAGNIEQTRALIKENLRLAKIYRCNWNYGNAIHDSNRLLGLIALSEGNSSNAAKYLIESGKSSGSPQLDSFGPNLDLANQLLVAGKTEEVIEYLNDITLFWDDHETLIDEWITQIEGGDLSELNQYGSLTFFESIALWLSLAWPFVITLVFWFKIKSYLSNKWSFPIIAIVAGYITMVISGLLMAPLFMAILPFLSNAFLTPVLIIISISMQFGLPLIAITIIARKFKQRSKQISG